MLLFISILGFIVSGLLFFYATKRFPGFIYLSLFFFINALWGWIIWAMHFGPVKYGAIANGHFMPILYLVGPLAWLFVRSVLTNDYKLKWGDIIHLLPFLVLLVGIIPFYFKDFSYKMDIISQLRDNENMTFYNTNFLLSNTFIIFSRMLIIIGYMAFSLYKVFSYPVENQNELVLNKPLVKNIRRWIILFLMASIFISFLYIIISLMIYRAPEDVSILQRNDILLIIMAGIYVLLNGSLFLKPSVLYGLPIMPQPMETEPESLSDEQPVDSNGKTENQPLQIFTDKYMGAIEKKIQTALIDKPFLRRDFSQSWLSGKTKIPVHHLSWYFRNKANIKFNDWRNQLRIQHAISLIEDDNFNKHSLSHIAETCGYSSTTTFFSAFKKITGTTPGEYTKKHLREKG